MWRGSTFVRHSGEGERPLRRKSEQVQLVLCVVCVCRGGDCAGSKNVRIGVQFILHIFQGRLLLQIQKTGWPNKEY